MPDSSSEIASDLEAPVSDANPPASSTEEPKGVETTLVDAVTAALNKGAESPTATVGKEAASSTDKPGKESDPDPADPGKYPKTSEGRIRQLNDQKKAAEAEVEKLRPVVAEVETLRKDAALSRQIMGYLDSNGVSPDELNNTLEITALIKQGRYEDAMKHLTPIWNELQTRTGGVLPKELAEQVRLGHMTGAAAQELHRSRMAAANASAREKATQERTSQRQQQEAHQGRVTAATTAVSDWDRQKATSDPDWHQKQPLVAEQVELELRRLGPQKYPATAKEAVALAERALKTVEGRFKAIAPKPVESRVLQGQGASPRSRAQPKTLMDAVNLALAGNG